MSSRAEVVALGRIEPRILEVRGQRVILDADLAALYEVKTKALNQAVRRNRDRFPPDFLFELTAEEKQEVVTNCDHLSRLRFSPTMPFAFTEHGTIMAASVLGSRRAVEASVFVVRAFVRMREVLSSHRDLSRKLDQLERKVLEHGEKIGRHDEAIRSLLGAIRQLMTPPERARREIGFFPEGKEPRETRKGLRGLSRSRRRAT